MTDVVTATELLPDPPPSVESEAFYAATAEGRFLIPVCDSCGRSHWYPRRLCPFCFGPTRWRPASGRGKIYSVTVMRRAPVYAIGYVTLEEGPSMLTNFVACDVDGLRIGDAVTVAFRPSRNGTMIPCFTPG